MTTGIEPTSILLLGNYRPALAVARSLAAEGHRILVSRDDDAGAAGGSRAVADLWQNPSSDDTVALYTALADYLAGNPEITTVFPLAETYVRNFWAHRHLLPDDRLYVMPNRSAVEICTEKSRLLQAVTDAGIPVARSVSVSDVSGLRRAVRDVGFPLIVKPDDSTVWIGMRKVLILRDQAQFDAALPDWPTGHGKLIVQTLVDGPRLNLYFAAANGRPIRYAAVRIGQTDLPDRTGLATDGVTIPLDPRLRDLGDTLIGLLGYHGVGCIQVLLGRDSGDLSFLELNPRIGGNHAITAVTGMELDRLAVALAADVPVDERLEVARPGIRYVWTTGALRGAAIALQHGELGIPAFLSRTLGVLALAVSTRTHITFRLDDPLPSLRLLGRAVPKRFRSFGLRRSAAD